MKPLDFVLTKNGSIGMITSIYYAHSDKQCDRRIPEGASIDFIYRNPNIPREKNSWWSKDEFEIINSLPYFLASIMAPSSLHDNGKAQDEINKLFNESNVINPKWVGRKILINNEICKIKFVGNEHIIFEDSYGELCRGINEIKFSEIKESLK